MDSVSRRWISHSALSWFKERGYTIIMTGISILILVKVFPLTVITNTVLCVPTVSNTACSFAYFRLIFVFR
jgi:hypothetical protein